MCWAKIWNLSVNTVMPRKYENKTWARCRIDVDRSCRGCEEMKRGAQK